MLTRLFEMRRETMQKTDPLIIEVDLNSLAVNGKRLPLPITEAAVIGMLGTPDRVIPGRPPAPPGHRNNEAYLYDALGIYWLRQHDSDRMIELTAVFRASDGPLRIPFMPRSFFIGRVRLPHLEVDTETSRSKFHDYMRDNISTNVASLSGGYNGQFHVSVVGKDRSPGSKLASISIGLRGRESQRTRPAS